MGWLDNKYVAGVAQGLKTGMADIGRSAITDIGNRYQEILMADATLRPSDILPGHSGDITGEIAQETPTNEIEHTVDPHHLEPYMDR
jgi:hypothetical protein